jgi:hypothetical protein
MDTSQKYILMCEKAEEIQKKYFDGYDANDIVYIPSSGELNFADKINMTGSIRYGKIFLTVECNQWIPRQDQLQQIMCGLGKK